MANAKTAQAGFQPDSNIHISFEDQQKINRFARLNAKMEDYKEENKFLLNELKNLEDASEELTLYDEDEKIPYHIGEVFVLRDLESTQKCLEEEKKKSQAKIADMESKMSALKIIMDELKAQLYAKFGININLEAEED